MHVLRPLVWIALVAAAFVAYRHVKARASAVAAWLGFGIVLRAALGVPLFLISLYELPLFQGLYTGGGFWAVALDAQSYFKMAADATNTGLGSITNAAPSPAFLRALAAWMTLVGIS